MTEKMFFVGLLCVLAGLAIMNDSPFLAFFIILVIGDMVS